jgi:hypothetical protein
MKKTYYLFNPGHLQRKDNTLKFTPIEEDCVSDLFVFGSLTANSALYNFLGQNEQILPPFVKIRNKQKHKFNILDFISNRVLYELKIFFC